LMWEEYILAPEPPNMGKEFFQEKLDPSTIEPSAKYIPAGEMVTFSVAKRCEHWSTAERDNYVFGIHAAGELTPLRFDARENRWTATAAIPMSGTVMLCTVDTVGNKDGKGLGVQGYLRAKGRQNMSFKGLAVWDVV